MKQPRQPVLDADTVLAFAEKMAQEFEQIAERRVQITPEQSETYREAAEHLRGRACYLTGGS